MINKKSVLITGGAGYIGTHLVDKLLGRGYRVCIIDQFIFGEEPISDFKRNKNFQFIRGNIKDSLKIRNALRGIDAVVHLAGLVGDPACAVDKDLTINMNIISTRIIKKLSKEAKVPRFIFVSSCSVYGASNRLMSENSKVNPMSLYAKTKIDSEEEILADKSKDFHPIILRLGTVFGHSKRPRFDLVGNLFVAQAYIDGKITLTGNTQWRSFIHVSDAAEAIVKTLEAPLFKVERQIFNVGDDSQTITIGSLARLAAGVVGRNKNGTPVQILINDDIYDKRNYKVSFKKIKKVLNFKAHVSLEKGLKEIYSNLLKNVYKRNYKDPIYSNVEMTKLLKMRLA